MKIQLKKWGYMIAMCNVLLASLAARGHWVPALCIILINGLASGVYAFIKDEPVAEIELDLFRKKGE